jgi:hypothetical protein
MITINHYHTDFTGEPSREQWQVFEFGVPWCKPVNGEQDAVAQARVIFNEMALPDKQRAFRLYGRTWFTTILDVSTGNTRQIELATI